jgi:hypothetical protein
MIQKRLAKKERAKCGAMRFCSRKAKSEKMKIGLLKRASYKFYRNLRTTIF